MQIAGGAAPVAAAAATAAASIAATATAAARIGCSCLGTAGTCHRYGILGINGQRGAIKDERPFPQQSMA